MAAKRTEAEEAAWLEAKAESRKAAEDFERDWIAERLAADTLAAARSLAEASGTAQESRMKDKESYSRSLDEAGALKQTILEFWNMLGRSPPQGRCVQNDAEFAQPCKCLKFLVHLDQYGNPYECDCCGHHAGYHHERYQEPQTDRHRGKGTKRQRRATSSSNEDEEESSRGKRPRYGSADTLLGEEGAWALSPDAAAIASPDKRSRRQIFQAPAQERRMIMATPTVPAEGPSADREREDRRDIGSEEIYGLSMSARLVLDKIQDMRLEGRLLTTNAVMKECGIGSTRWKTAIRELRRRKLINHDGTHWFRPGCV